MTTAIAALLCAHCATAKVNGARAYNNLCFVENKGQITDQYLHSRNDIDFSLAGSNCTIFIGKGQIHYQWHKITNAEKLNAQFADKRKPPKNPADIQMDMYRMDVALLGANKNAAFIHNGNAVFKENYYLSHLPRGLTTRGYASITYKDIYPNIDWVIYTNSDNNQSFKYEFIVHKGGDAKKIRLRYKGFTSLQLKDGSCWATTPMGTITEQKPYCYNAVTKQQMQSAYKLNDDILSFDIQACDEEYIIDPVLNWGTYYGNPNTTWGVSVTTDSAGNAYMCGNSFTPGNTIATVGTHQTVFAGGKSDCYIVKFNPAGNRVWGSYYGGNDWDYLYACTSDDSDYVYLTGLTYSTVGLTTPGTHQTQNNGDPYNSHSLMEGFLGKFNPNDGQLVWGTLYGGLYIDFAMAVACDKQGAVYIGGATTSGDSIASNNAFQTTPNAGFLAKFSAANGTRIWGTFYNGGINAISCAYDGSIFIGGTTNMYTGIHTTGAYQTSFAGGTYDAFIARFTSNGSRVWGTYYGRGNNLEGVSRLATDVYSNVYVGLDSAYTVTTDSIIKFNASGKRLWGVGNTDNIGSITSMFIGPEGNCYYSSIRGVPFTPISYTYFGKISAQGKKKWLSLLSDTTNFSWAAYTFSKYYYCGTTLNQKGITTNNGFIKNPTPDTPTAFLQQYEADTNVYFPFPFIDDSLCTNDSIKIKFRSTNYFKSNNVFYIELSDNHGQFTTTTPIGSKADFRPGEISCYIPNTLPQADSYLLRIRSTAPADTFYNYNKYIKVRFYHIPIAFAYTNPLCKNATLNLDDANRPYATDYTWYGPYGYVMPTIHNIVRKPMKDSMAGDYIVVCVNDFCIGRDTVTVSMYPSPDDAIISGDTSICIGDSIHLHAFSPSGNIASYAWLGPAPNFYAPKTQDLTIPVSAFIDSGIYKVIAIDSNLCTSDQDATARFVKIHPLPYPTAKSSNPLCAGDTIKLIASDTLGGITYTWTGPMNFTSSAKDTIIANSSTDESGNYVITTKSIFGCTNRDTSYIIVKPMPEMIEASSNSPICSNDTLNLNTTNSTTGCIYSWTGPGSYAVAGQYAQRTMNKVQYSGIYTITANLNGCTISDTTNVVIYQSPDKMVLKANTPLLFGENLDLNIENAVPGITYTWTGPNNYTSSAPHSVINNVINSAAGSYIAVAKDGMCSVSDTINIEVKSKPGQDNLILIKPNPNNGLFQLLISAGSDSEVPVKIYTTEGKLVYSEIYKPLNKKIDTTIDLRGRASSGIYRFKALINGEIKEYNILIGSY